MATFYQWKTVSIQGQNHFGVFMRTTPDGNSFSRELLDHLTDGVYFTDTERRITHWNKGAEALCGFSLPEAVGKRCNDHLLMHIDASGHELCMHDCPLEATLQDGQPREVDVFLRHKQGHRIPMHVRVAAIKDDAGAIMGAVEIFSDNAAHVHLPERFSQREQPRFLDPLTGLWTPCYLESVIRMRLDELRTHKWDFGILYADIDNFRLINCRLGVEVGDRVLQMVGRTLKAASRQFDVVCRCGGEEFMVVAAEADVAVLRKLGEHLKTLVERSELTEPEPVRVTVSIGGAQALSDDTVMSVWGRADKQLYLAKRSGRNRFLI